MKKRNYPAFALVIIGWVVLVVGYFLQASLVPVQDPELLSKADWHRLQLEVAFNYPLGRALLYLGGGIFLLNLPVLIYQKFIKNKRNSLGHG